MVLFGVADSKMDVREQNIQIKGQASQNKAALIYYRILKKHIKFIIMLQEE